MSEADSQTESEQTATAGPARDAAPLLRLRNVSRTFHTGDVAVTVLRDVNLEVPRGQIMVIVGPSGSGKSTLLNIIGGIDSPSTGEVWFGDRDLARLNDAALTRYRRESVGFVFQFYNLVPTLTALENVVVSSQLSDNAMDPAEALKMVGLEHRTHHFPSQLSGGEQQRVAIARAIAGNPEILLCDEPTGALDLETGRNVLELLDRLNRDFGRTVLIITHNSAIAAMAHQQVRIGSGTIAEAKANPRRVSAGEISW